MAMVKDCILVILVALSFVAAAGCRDSAEHTLTVSAAASTREALEQLASEFHEQTGTTVSVNFGPSSTLAKQIEQGGPATIFLSADEGWADYLERAGLVEQRRNLLGNRLVVIVPKEGALKLTGLQDLGTVPITRLALAGPGVPAGEYARQALKKAGVWERLRERVVSGNDVRGALAFVEQGEVDAGIVYQTDAVASQRVKIVLNIPEQLHQPIRYPLVLLRQQNSRPEARRFFDFLGWEQAAEVFRQAGFQSLGGPPP
jgi:molybdate transport system substrate-binding protein